MPSSGVQKCALDRKSTRLNSSHGSISYAVFCLSKSRRLDSSHGSISSPVFSFKKEHTDDLHAQCVLSVHDAHATAVLTRFQHDLFFFLKEPATPEIHTLSHPVALPI